MTATVIQVKIHVPGVRGMSAPPSPEPQPSPAHVEATVGAISRLHQAHHQNATRFQQQVNRATSLLANPWFFGALSIFLALWTAGNGLAGWFGFPPVDQPPFPQLSLAVGIVSLFMVLLVLITQRHEDELALHREQLILELVIANEQKTTKVIQLPEAIRRDDPYVENRVDAEAEAMARPADPFAVVDAIRVIHTNKGSDAS
jgi:uncharacterized membrane protein